MNFLFSVFLAKFLFVTACFCLVLHMSSCLLVAMRRPRQKLQAEMQNVTLLCPLDGRDKECQSKSLRSAFAETYPKKEIIFCAVQQDNASLADIRSVRERHAETPSLLIILPDESSQEPIADKASPLQQCMVKAWKAARYDHVINTLPNANLPPDYIIRFLNAEKNTVKNETRFVCAVLWAVNPHGLQQRLKTVFFNSFRARRLALADSFGTAIATDTDCLGGATKMSAALWDYDMLHKIGGIDKFLQKAAQISAAAAITELIWKQNGRIYLTARPLSLDLGARQNQDDSSKQNLRYFLQEQVEWLKIYRRLLPYFFYAELLLAPLLPILAWTIAWILGLLSLSGLFGFIGLWYAVELVFCVLWKSGKSGGLKTYLFLPLRDILLPVLWFCAALQSRKPKKQNF